jgi:hypothetical protein
MTRPGAQVPGATGQYARAFRPETQPHVFKMSDGAHVMVYAGTALHSDYNVKKADGTWLSAASILLPNNVLAITGTLAPFAVAQNGDTVVIFDRQTNTTLRQTTLPWNASTHTMGTVTTATLTVTTMGSAYAMAAAWVASISRWYIASFMASASTATSQSHLVPDGVGSISAFSTLPGYTGTSFGNCQGIILVSGTAAKVIGYSTPKTAVTVVPVALTASSITYSAAEFPKTTANFCDVSAAFDGSGNIDIVWGEQTSPYSLNTIKRSGTNVYGAAIKLADVNGSGDGYPHPALSYDSTTDTLFVLFGLYSNTANGEVASMSRSSAGWSVAPAVLAGGGGDTTGYQFPSAQATLESGKVNFLYTVGGGSTPILDYASLAVGAAPNTPTLSAPTSVQGTLTPTGTWAYVNSVPSDPQYSYEVLVKRVSDNVVMWDSGEVVSTNTSAVYAGTGLAYNVQYQWQVRVKDNVTRTFSAYSAAALFTVYHAPIGVITSITPQGGSATSGTASSTLSANTAVSAVAAPVQTGHGVRFAGGQVVAVGVSPNIDTPTISSISTDTLNVPAMAHAHSSTDPVVEADSTATLTGQTMDVTFAITQADGHTADGYQLDLLDSSGTNVVLTTGMVTLSPALASGSTKTHTAFGSNAILNATTYKLRLTVRDATTGLSYVTASWTITTSFSAPSSPTGYTATPNTAGGGSMDLAWTNPGAAVLNGIYWREHGASAWNLVSNTSLRTSVRLFHLPIGTSLDVAVSAINSSGIESAYATASAVTISILGGMGILLSDADAPASAFAWLGVGDSTNEMSGLDHVEDVTSYVPEMVDVSGTGQYAAAVGKPIEFRGPSDYWTTSSALRFFLPAYDGPSGLYGDATLAALIPLATTGRTVLYRNVTGEVRFVSLKAFHKEQSVMDWIVTFAMNEVRRLSATVVI